MALNKYICIGRLTATPEIKKTQSDKSVVSFSVAVEKPYNKTNDHPEANFIDCVAWEKTAEFIAKYFQKGSKIAIVGSIQTRNYEDKDKKKHKMTEVLVETVDFVEKKSESSSNINEASVSETISTANIPSEENIGDNDLPF